jgi:Flp pilus assembly protein TadD
MVSLGTITILRNQDYQSEIALWQSTVKTSPNKSRVYNNLGFAYDQAGEKEAAKQAYKKAIALDSGNWLARNNLQKLTDLPPDVPVQTGK